MMIYLPSPPNPPPLLQMVPLPPSIMALNPCSSIAIYDNALLLPLLLLVVRHPPTPAHIVHYMYCTQLQEDVLPQFMCISLWNTASAFSLWLYALTFFALAALTIVCSGLPINEI